MEELQFYKDSYISVNPLSKIAAFFFSSLIMMSVGEMLIEDTVICVMLVLLLNTKERSAFIKFFFFSFGMMIVDYMTYAFHWPIFFFVVSKFGKMFLPSIMGFYILSKQTSSIEFMACFHRFKFPSFLQIPFVVMLRFIPTVQETSSDVMKALKIRGLNKKYFYKHPIDVLEYLIVPSLMSCSRSMDELASAAICRGFNCRKKRTYVAESKFGLVDITLIFLFVILLFWKKVVLLWRI